MQIYLSYSPNNFDAVKLLLDDLRNSGFSISTNIFTKLQEGVQWKNWQEAYKGIAGSDIAVICLSTDFLNSDQNKREIQIAHTLKKKVVFVMIENCWGELDKQTDTIFPSRRDIFDLTSNYQKEFMLLIQEILGRSVENQEPRITKEASLSEIAKTLEDWGEAPTGIVFKGREDELRELSNWIVNNRCKVVTILGIGGIGKTALMVQLAKKVSADFQFVIWRSLKNAPPCNEVLRDFLLIISRQRETDLQTSTEHLTSLLLRYLQTNRCLIILDNFESVLESGINAGQCKQEYEGYCQLIRRIGESDHQSTLIISSREKPNSLTQLEGPESFVRSLRLKGLDNADSKVLLEDKHLKGNDEAWNKLIESYAGNPLALKLVSSTIQSIFDYDINKFIQQDMLVFSDIKDVLDEQFNRLSLIEKEIMYWLAIEREWVDIDSLQECIISTTSKSSLLSALVSLERRSIIERNDGPSFSLQPVVMEYLTNRFLHNLSLEIISGKLLLMVSHAIINTRSKEYIRNAQVRIILVPLIEMLSSTLGKDAIESKILQAIEALYSSPNQSSGYAVGNSLNILSELNGEIVNKDFSGLTIRGAYLRNTHLHDVNFSNCRLYKTVFMETFGSVLSVKFSRDGQLIASGTTTNEIRIWRTRDGKQVQLLKGHSDWVRAADFSKDNTLIVSCSEDQTIRVWDIETGQCIHTLTGHAGRIRSVVFNPDSTLIASGCEDLTVGVWDSSSENPLKFSLKGHTLPIRCVTFSHNGKYLLSSSDDETIRLWDCLTGECLRIYRGHKNQVWSVAFSPNDDFFCSGGEDQTVRLWNVESEKETYVFTGHSSPIRSVSFGTDGRLIASGSEDQTIRVWDVHLHTCKHTLYGHLNRVRSVDFSPVNNLLASGSEDQTLRLWEIENGQCISTLQGYINRIWSVAFSSNGTLLAGGNDNKSIELWNTENGTILKSLTGHENQVRSVVFSSDDKLLVSASDDHKIRVWDLHSSTCLNILSGHNNRVGTVTLSPNGKLIASGSDDQTIRIWNLGTGECLAILRGHKGWVWSIAFSPDGKSLISGSEDKTTKLWDVASGECLATFETGRVWSVAMHPDGNIVALGCDDRIIRLLDMQNSRDMKMLHGHEGRGIWSVNFHPSGDILASGSDDQTVKLWDISSGQCMATLIGHTARLRSVCFNPSGTLLASAGDDEKAILWETATSRAVRTLRSPRPYEGLNITGISGLTDVQKISLFALGAIDTGHDHLGGL
jgi:WD40 repeat protein